MKNYVPGCVYIIYTKQERDELLKTGHFSIIRTQYIKYPKWMFWKRKKVGYYEMMYSFNERK